MAFVRIQFDKNIGISILRAASGKKSIECSTGLSPSSIYIVITY